MATGINTFQKIAVSELLIDHNTNARQADENGSYDTTRASKHSGPSTISALRASIRRDGLQNPILVRKLTTDRRTETGFIYELLGGYRRMEAIAEIKGMTDVPAMVMPDEATHSDAIGGALVNNIQRNNLTPAEIAMGVTDLKEALEEDGQKATLEIVAKHVGLSKGYVSNLINLRKLLIPEVWDAFAGGHEKATVRTLADDVMHIDDPVMQLQKWESLVNEKKGSKGGDGGDNGDTGDGDTPTEKPPHALSRKAILEAMEFLKAHRKHATEAQTQDATYYRAAIQWLQYAAGDRKPPLKIRTYGGDEANGGTGE